MALGSIVNRAAVTGLDLFKQLEFDSVGVAGSDNVITLTEAQKLKDATGNVIVPTIVIPVHKPATAIAAAACAFRGATATTITITTSGAAGTHIVIYYA